MQYVAEGYSVSDGHFSLTALGHSVSDGVAPLGSSTHESVSDGFIVQTMKSSMIGSSVSDGFCAAKYIMIAQGESISDGDFKQTILLALSKSSCYVLNLQTKRTYEYANYNMLGVGEHNAIILAAKSNGIFDILTKKTVDDLAQIDAYLEFATDFGIPNNKAIRSVYVEDNQVLIDIKGKDDEVTTLTLDAYELTGLPKNTISRYYKFKISNLGKPITIRRLAGKLDILAMKGE